MEGKENISQYRDKLDKTLMSPDLSNVESLKILVENQMSSEDQEYSNNLVQKRTKEVANFLSMLRSASGSAVEGSKANEIPQGGWKIKHDNQDCRVMYREGPAGTPFHTLLAEGYVDGPLDVCLCISWEAGLYQKWWPQFNIPAFKVLSSECVKKIRMGEQISLVRMKLSWPLSTREALVHYVTLDYFQDDLIIVLLNTISESENIDKNTHGFTRDGIPDVENVTRIDVVGGLALQKVSANRSYFRTIVNMDIKLDFVPPAIINFVSRQLVGSGFKLYKKEVASVSKGDADFSKALKEPFYGRIREALFSDNKLPNGVLKQEDVNIVHDAGLKQKDIKIDHGALEQETVKIVEPEEHCNLEGKEAKYERSVSEIEEIEESRRSHEDDNSNEHPTNKFINDCRVIVGEKQVIISPEVKQALGTLEKVISVFREFGFNPRSLSLSRFTNNVFAELEDHKTNDSKLSVAPTNDFTVRTSQRNSFSSHSSRQGGCISCETETQDHEVGLASQKDETLSSRGSHRSSFSFAINEAITSTQNTTMNGEVNNSDESHKKMKKQRFCCLNFTSGRGFS